MELFKHHEYNTHGGNWCISEGVTGMQILKGVCGEEELEKKLQEMELDILIPLLKEKIKRTARIISPRYREKQEENF